MQGIDKDSKPADAEMASEIQASSAQAFLQIALGGNTNVATLTFLALTELLDAYAKHLLATIDRQAEQIKELRNAVQALKDAANGDYWAWQGDGDDHLESLVCPVLIRPEKLAEIIKQIKAKDDFIEELVRVAQRVIEVKEWAGGMPGKYTYYTTTLDERISAVQQALKGDN